MYLPRGPAREPAGPKHPGKAGSAIVWYVLQNGVVSLAERKLRISKPRLRRKGTGTGKSCEVEIPAYAAMRTQSRLGGRMLDILMSGVAARNYREALPEMAETVGVSKSRVNRGFIEASEKALKEPAERRKSVKLGAWLSFLRNGRQATFCPSA